MWARVGGDIANGPTRQLVRRGKPSAVHDIWHRAALFLFRNISSLGHRAYLPNFPSRARDHGGHFSEGNRALQIFEAAVRCHDNSLGWHVRQCAPDARSDSLRCLDIHIRQVERAEDDGLT